MKDLDLGKRTHFSVEELEINWILMIGKNPIFPWLYNKDKGYGH